MRKSLKGNDSMVWKEWAPAGLEVPTTWSPILGDGGELVHRGLTREGQAFLSGAKTEQPHLPLGFPPHHISLEQALGKRSSGRNIYSICDRTEKVS